MKIGRRQRIEAFFQKLSGERLGASPVAANQRADVQLQQRSGVDSFSGSPFSLEFEASLGVGKHRAHALEPHLKDEVQQRRRPSATGLGGYSRRACGLGATSEKPRSTKIRAISKLSFNVRAPSSNP